MLGPGFVGCCLFVGASVGWASGPTPEQKAAWLKEAETLREQVRQWRAAHDGDRAAADVEVCAKAVLWIVRHDEFFKPEYAQWTDEVLALGKQRLTRLQQGTPDWWDRPGKSAGLGYDSQLDGSVQPFAVTLPPDFDRSTPKRWPLHVVLHGRNAQLNEVSFLRSHEGKTPKEPVRWIQLDVFGRTNNAYRWAGEVDVFEALSTVKRLYPIDEQRITLWGFSMGGAGAWHLGLHYPDQWSSVGAGAGFAETVEYLKLPQPLSPLHTRLVRIYDAVDYALNAFNVPTIGYGGELDKQLAAAQRMHHRARELGVDIQLLVGPQTEHKFHPDSWREFLAFHQQAAEQGRPGFLARREIRFTTCTVKYNTCGWVTIEEQQVPYEPSTVHAVVSEDGEHVKVTTHNVAVLQLARDVADVALLDDSPPLPLRAAAEGLLPGVYYERRDDRWTVLPYDASHDYLTRPTGRKRRHLQGPLDDAFTRPFVCVRPTGRPWNEAHAAWVQWTLERFAREYDKYFRAELPVVNDNQVTEELLEEKHLILFGDPGSNSVLARVIDQLPCQWTRNSLVVAGRQASPDQQAVVLVYPNPLHPSRYVVVNSGHTFHAAEFQGSNALLYPRLGDIALIAFQAQPQGDYRETVLWSEIFDRFWDLP